MRLSAPIARCLNGIKYFNASPIEILWAGGCRCHHPTAISCAPPSSDNDNESCTFGPVLRFDSELPNVRWDVCRNPCRGSDAKRNAVRQTERQDCPFQQTVAGSGGSRQTSGVNRGNHFGTTVLSRTTGTPQLHDSRQSALLQWSVLEKPLSGHSLVFLTIHPIECQFPFSEAVSVSGSRSQFSTPCVFRVDCEIHVLMSERNSTTY